MSLISAKTLLPGTGIAMGGAGSAYTTYNSDVFSAAGNFTLPAGDWWVLPTADTSVQVSIDGGTTWETVYPVTTGGFIRSDGANARINATAAITVYYFGPA